MGTECLSSSSSSSSYLMILVFCVSSFISGIFGSHASIGRHLLQVPKGCPINFENQNYTIITSQCKGPNYQQKPCCTALKEFACPFRDELDDLSNDCAKIMFSYINAYKYPSGLFSNLCTEGKEGLDCSALSPSESAIDTNTVQNTSGVHSTRSQYQQLIFVSACLVLLLWML